MTAAKLQGNFESVEIKLTIKVSKQHPEMLDMIAGRVYNMDGIEDVTVALLEGEQSASAEPPERVTQFDSKIRAFNKLYNLACPAAPTIPSRAELIRELNLFYDILLEELKEVYPILQSADRSENLECDEDILTDIADWLGDIMVYCASQLAKYGLQSDDVLGIIMASNMSKLGPDGKPIYDERGKVLKGPSYWKPEPMIKRMILARIRQSRSL
jgi:predicted HAD superfamily Cof-like phosphohydrolase